MKVAVLGCGRWGAFHAWYANHIGHAVMLWGRPGSSRLAALRQSRGNEYLTLPQDVVLTEDLATAVAWADVCIISISAQALRSLAKNLAALPLAGQIFLLCMKGLEAGTGKRLSTVLREEIGDQSEIAVWVGPGHVQDFLRDIPNCMIIASQAEALTQRLAKAFTSPLIRFYYGEDLLGTEIGAAAKNVIGLAAGMLDGFQYGSLKGALMARATRELSRLVAAMGGDPMTIYGLSHLGDYEATLFSPYSNNRRYGENLILGKPSAKLAEGVSTSKALMALAEQYHIELPICRVVHDIVCREKNPREELLRLFLRTMKRE